MAQTSVAQFASELKVPPSVLLEQLRAAGVEKRVAEDSLTETDKARLLEYLRKSHGSADAKNKITLTRKQTSEIKKSDSMGKVLHTIPFLDQHPSLLFLVYYLVFDFVYYWMHRVQHALPWWWALHSLHHSQRQVSCWTNDRECFVGGLLEASVLASVGLVLGVDPAEFALLILVGELIQNFSHANVRIGFGKWLNTVLVGPAFHRLHHMRAESDRPGLHNCNFAQAFPVWDILFGTALYGERARTTGVADPEVDADNERGLIGQQWTALRRFWGAIRRRAGWTPGEVSFGEGYVPIPESLTTSLGRIARNDRSGPRHLNH